SLAPPPSSSFCCPDPSPPQLYTLSLHDALPILVAGIGDAARRHAVPMTAGHAGSLWGSYFTAGPVRNFAEAKRSDTAKLRTGPPDRKSTRLNSSHQIISYAVFCLKKKTQDINCD